MPLDPDAAAYLERLQAAAAPPPALLTPDQLRALHIAGSPAVAAPGPPVADVHDDDADGVPVRVYVPDGARGVTVYLHGGGWVVGTLDTYDHVCRELADRSATTVVAVDYALAPERRHPVQVEQCLRALSWATRLGGPVALAGDSAGGHLAGLVAARTDVPLAALALVYPVVGPDLDTPSARSNATGYGLETETMRWYWQHYLPDEPTDVPVDLRQADPHRWPATYLIVAGYDPLRDEGVALAEAARAAGVAVTLREYAGQVHGFFRTTAVIPEGRAAQEQVAAFLRAHL